MKLTVVSKDLIVVCLPKLFGMSETILTTRAPSVIFLHGPINLCSREIALDIEPRLTCPGIELRASYMSCIEFNCVALVTLTFVYLLCVCSGS